MKLAIGGLSVNGKQECTRFYTVLADVSWDFADTLLGMQNGW